MEEVIIFIYQLRMLLYKHKKGHINKMKEMANAVKEFKSYKANISFWNFADRKNVNQILIMLSKNINKQHLLYKNFIKIYIQIQIQIHKNTLKHSIIIQYVIMDIQSLVKW